MIWFIAIAAFAFRAFPRLLRKNTIPSDTYFHMFCASMIRENHFRVPESTPRVVLKNRHTYPFLYHLFLAFFPDRLRPWAERLTPAFCDTIMLLSLYLFSTWAIGRHPDIAPSSLPIAVAFFFAFSPALLRTTWGPRIHSGSPRVLGELLYFIHILAFWVGFETGNYIFWTISLLAGALLVVTAKFGNQVLLFFGVWFAVLVTPLYGLLLLASFLLSVLVTKGKAIDVIMGQIRHSTFYYKYSQRIYLYPAIPTAREYLRNVRNEARLLLRRHLYEPIRWYNQERFFLHQLVSVYPQFVFLAFVWQAGNGSPLGRFLTVWCAAAFFWFLITRIRPLLFLGEADRYLEYALFPSLFLSVGFLLDRNLLIAVLLFALYSIALILFHLRLYLKTTPNDHDKTEALFSALAKLDEGVVMPIGSFHWQTLHRSMFPVLTLGCNNDERFMSADEFRLLYGNYPYPSERFDEIIDRYNVRYVLSDKSQLTHYMNTILGNPEKFLRRAEMVFEGGDMLLYRVK